MTKIKRRKNKERRNKNCDKKKEEWEEDEEEYKEKKEKQNKKKTHTHDIHFICLSLSASPPRTGASRCVWIAERLTSESRKINIGSCAAPSQCLSHPIKIEKTISSRQHITWEQLISSRYPLRENGP